MKRDVQTGPLTAQELNYAKLLWDFHVLYKHYSDIINKVKQRKGSNGKDQLNLQLDENGTLSSCRKMIITPN